MFQIVLNTFEFLQLLEDLELPGRLEFPLSSRTSSTLATVIESKRIGSARGTWVFVVDASFRRNIRKIREWLSDGASLDSPVTQFPSESLE